MSRPVFLVVFVSSLVACQKPTPHPTPPVQAETFNAGEDATTMSEPTPEPPARAVHPLTGNSPGLRYDHQHNLVLSTVESTETGLAVTLKTHHGKRIELSSEEPQAWTTITVGVRDDRKVLRYRFELVSADATPPGLARVIIERVVLGEATAMRIEKGQVLPLDETYGMTFRHGHKRTSPGQKSPLIVRARYVRLEEPEEEIGRAGGNMFPKEGDNTWWWRHFRFELGEYQYDQFMEMQVMEGTYESVDVQPDRIELLGMHLDMPRGEVLAHIEQRTGVPAAATDTLLTVEGLDFEGHRVTATLTFSEQQLESLTLTWDMDDPHASLADSALAPFLEEVAGTRTHYSSRDKRIWKRGLEAELQDTLIVERSELSPEGLRRWTFVLRRE